MMDAFGCCVSQINIFYTIFKSIVDKNEWNGKIEQIKFWDIRNNLCKNNE